MTYCLGIITRQGLVMASDLRTNAGFDQVNVTRKMHTLVLPGERVFVLLTSGSLSLSQSIIALLTKDFEQGAGLAGVPSMYDAAREVGTQVRRVSELDRAALERDDFRFNVNFLLGGQIKGQKHDLYMIYPQGNPLAATEDLPYLQIGEVKYGRPILDRGVVYGQTSLEEAAKYALLSLDLDDALQRHCRPPRGSARVCRRRPGRSAPAPLHRQRPRPARHPPAMGTDAAQRRPRPAPHPLLDRPVNSPCGEAKVCPLDNRPVLRYNRNRWECLCRRSPV